MFEAIVLLLGIVKQLIERAEQSGELTPEQRTALTQRAATVFLRFENAAPPPPPGA